MNNILFEEEFNNQNESLAKSDLIVLYGNSVIACILKSALIDLGYNTQCVIFDKGSFVNDFIDISQYNNIVVYLCSSRINTRNDMTADAVKFFSGADIFDYFAVYYKWITDIIKRKCDTKVLAITLHKCRLDDCIHNIDSINTLYCNLKCKECSNGIQYRKEKRVINVDSQISHLKKITDLISINQCNFQGGEVFTDVNFSTFIEKHAENPHIAFFTVATNGTILPPDNVFESIRNIGGMIRISDYGSVSVHKQDIFKKCKEFNIPCFKFPMAERWRKFGTFKARNRLESELKAICKQCCFGTHDMMFIDDKIFCCLRTLFADAIGETNEAMASNTLDLNSDFDYNTLMSFVNGDKLWKMCDYCDYPMDYIEPAEQL